MGQAKDKREKIRLKLLETADSWSFPPSAWEASVVEELQGMKVSIVPKASEGFLENPNIQENRCHVNVATILRQSAAEGIQDLERITGWMIEGSNYVLHSVLKVDELVCCVTPSSNENISIQFIPDIQIRWELIDGAENAFKNGNAVQVGVRKYPQFEIEKSKLFKKRLLELKDPHLAVELPPKQQDELRRLYLS